MGLGKTVQALAFLRLVRGPKLVVCPASLTLNWMRETQRFAPDLKPVLASDIGPEGLPATVADEPLLITSYGLLRRDIATLKQLGFTAAVLDEGTAYQESGQPNREGCTSTPTRRCGWR
jgi:SNF2 family DNA or RNA helicase